MGILRLIDRADNYHMIYRVDTCHRMQRTTFRKSYRQVRCRVKDIVVA
jgi:hypothetical protein